MLTWLTTRTHALKKIREQVYWEKDIPEKALDKIAQLAGEALSIGPSKTQEMIGIEAESCPLCKLWAKDRDGIKHLLNTAIDAIPIEHERLEPIEQEIVGMIKKIIQGED